MSVPFPIDTMMGKKLGMPGQVNVTLVGFEEEAKKLGYTRDDLSRKGMHCQASGGGPTRDPIVLIQAMASQPCKFFVPAASVKEKQRPSSPLPQQVPTLTKKSIKPDDALFTTTEAWMRRGNNYAVANKTDDALRSYDAAVAFSLTL